MIFKIVIINIIKGIFCFYFIMVDLESVQKAANIHKKVRNEIRYLIKPGVKIYDICTKIEDKIRDYSEPNLNDGIGFPTGISLNHVAAHYTPDKNDNYRLQYDDVCKIDFGVHHDGWIIDSAFTVNFNPKWDPLLEASKDAVKNVIKNCGDGVRVSELGEISEEIVRSYEINGVPLKPIDNLYGHSINQWKIHGGKFIPGVKNDLPYKLKAGEFYAIEIFPSTGYGTTKLDGESSHYMLKDNYSPKKFKFKRSSQLLNLLNTDFKTLPFCPRFLNYKYNINYEPCIKELFYSEIISSHPPLIDNPGSKISQFEHTIYVSESNVINLSEGDDY